MMTREDKIDFISSKIIDMFEDVQELLPNQIDKVLNSGAIPFDEIIEGKDSTIIGRAILIAILSDTINKYTEMGVSYSTKVKKEAKNISYLL
jgi:hypothetical protein